MGEELDLERIALEVGTPCYVYSRAALLSNVRTLQEALHRIKPLVCFAVKANQNLAVLRLFADEGAGFDIVSGGELYRVLRCGADPAKVIYSGVGKTQEEIEMALAKGILMFNVESRQEIELIRSCARQLRKTATIALRVNPDIAVQSHPYMQTGTHHHKFGIDYEEIPAIAAYLRRQPEIRLRGIACHIGSQITSLQPFEKAFKRMAWMFRELCASGIQLETINLGGGLGVRYKDEKPVGAENYAQLLEKHICPLGARILLEPGRYLVRDAGLLMTRLLYTKTTRGKIFYIVDAGMNDLVRPTLYHAWHEIQPLRQVGGELLQVDVVGPLCETGDFLARNRQLPRLRPGALLAVMQAAAYGQVQSSNYNARRRAPEVMIQGNRYSLIRRRETYADLLFQETLG
jgi:diaminopimelate decarboxylase